MSVFKYIKEPWRLIVGLNYHGFGKFIPDKVCVKCLFRYFTGYPLNLKHPRTYNEKLQWLKLYNRKSEYTSMVDKYAVKKYVSETIGEQYVIPTLGVWEKFDDIDFDALPDQFVLKCTHDSGGLVICKDKSKLDLNTAKKKLDSSLKYNFFYCGREWPYKNVPPRIIAEKYMQDGSSEELRDYKFFCFNGNPTFCQVISDRNTNETIDFFNMQWEHQDFTGLALPHKPFCRSTIPMPENFEKMKESATVLSKNIPFVRVDFYSINGSVYFGEITFFPASGFGVFTPDIWNKKIGDLLELPKK